MQDGSLYEESIGARKEISLTDGALDVTYEGEQTEGYLISWLHGALEL